MRSGARSALSFVDEAIADIETRNAALCAVTRLLADRARSRAGAVDAIVAGGGDPGPLAGVPFGVKDLFDVAGLPTTAGAGMRRDAAPATEDAEAVCRLEAAGGVLVATLNMDEYAYGFATVNATFGTTRNPHDPQRLAGGSSGGSAAAVAAGLLPLTLGSDTNGSIRVPAALCGIFGLRPTHGALPLGGAFPFVDRLDVIGPFTRSARELDIAWRALGGLAASANPAPRIARLDGWFMTNVEPGFATALDALDAYLGGLPRVALPDVARARSASFLITAAEGGARHLPELKARALEFDPATRDRLIAGALQPAATYAAALEFADRFRSRVEALFTDHDVLIAPAVGGVAPRIDAATIEVDGKQVPARANLGLFTQPLSLAGMPILAAPLRWSGALPVGVQLVGRWGDEATLLALAERLESEGWLGAPTAP